jgi:hypothetical protein
VLRAKVSVFVDLWIKGQQLKAQAEQWAQLSSAVEAAIGLLGADDMPEAARRAKAKLEAAREGY